MLHDNSSLVPTLIKGLEIKKTRVVPPQSFPLSAEAVSEHQDQNSIRRDHELMKNTIELPDEKGADIQPPLKLEYRIEGSRNPANLSSSF